MGIYIFNYLPRSVLSALKRGSEYKSYLVLVLLPTSVAFPQKVDWNENGKGFGCLDKEL